MFRSKDFLPDPDRFLQERLGFGVFAHRLVEQGQVIEILRCGRMFRSQDFVMDAERFQAERFGFGIIAHRPVERGQVNEDRQHFLAADNIKEYQISRRFHPWRFHVLLNNQDYDERHTYGWRGPVSARVEVERYPATQDHGEEWDVWVILEAEPDEGR